MGRVESGDRAVVWVEQYQPIACNHRFGPQFVLDDEDATTLENAAAAILKQANSPWSASIGRPYAVRFPVGGVGLRSDPPVLQRSLQTSFFFIKPRAPATCPENFMHGIRRR